MARIHWDRSAGGDGDSADCRYDPGADKGDLNLLSVLVEEGRALVPS